MNILLEKTGSISALQEAIREISADKTVAGIFILACDANGFIPKNLDPVLRSVRLPLFGGIFPGILHNREKLEKGTLVVGLSFPPDVQLIENLSDKNANYDELIEGKFPDTKETNTMFVLVDGFSQRISSLVDSLFMVFGLEFNYLGGGAGSLSMQQKPCLMTNSGLRQDCAVLAALSTKSGIGVRHGWTKIAGPFRVTESDRNIVKSLDGRSAFSVYKEVIESHSGQLLTKSNFFEISKAFPFGISKLEDEHIVRDPLMVGERNSLICVGEVPSESFVSILTGDVESLVHAAGSALFLAKSSQRSKLSGRTTLFIDCISRVLFMGDDFSKELDAVYEEHIPLIGALTIGEVANSKKDYLEFYNKTAVVGVLED